MANEIQHAHDSTGATLYAVIRNSAGQCWSTDAVAFETQVNANWVSGHYAIAVAEDTPASGYYYMGDVPAGATGVISITIHLKVGGSHAVSDPIVGVIPAFTWDGSQAAPTDVNVTHLNGDADAVDGLAASAATIILDTVDTGFSESQTTLKGGGTATLSGVDNFYNGRVIIFTDGTLENQATVIEDYDGSAKIFTVATLTAAPTDGDAFIII